MTLPSLDGRVFRDATPAPSGDVGGATRFAYHERDGLIWARYEGGAVRLGFLVGTREGDTLRFRYTHVTADGRSSAGRCESMIRVDEGGLLECHEAWEWESQEGGGTSVIREVRE